MHTESEVIRQWLLDEGLGNDTTWQVKMENVPNEPVQLIGIVTTSALKQGRLMRTGEVIQKPRLEIQIRTQLFKTGKLKSVEIEQAIDSLYKASVTVGGSLYTIQNITRDSGFVSLGTDLSDKRNLEWFALPIQVTMAAAS